jgi:DNA-directed RNA polymerase subunit RPC12/RpoP
MEGDMRRSKEIKKLIASIERPKRVFKCSNCGFEIFDSQNTDWLNCPHCFGGKMLRQDIVEFIGVPEVDNKLAEEYMNKYHFKSFLQAADNLDIDDMDSTEWMML